MDQDEQKEAIMGLRLRERTVAVALKGIFDRIKLLKQEANEELQSVKEKYYPRFKVIQDETNKIIKGNSIANGQINQCLQFFTNEEPSHIHQIAEHNRKMDGYWQKTLINFYGEQLTQADRQIGRSITAISLNYFKGYIELSFQIGANSYVRSEVFTKRCQIEEGCLSGVSGEAGWLKPRPDGIFGLLFSENSASDLIESTLVITQQFIVQVVPYSLQHYLGANDHIEAQEEEMIENFNELTVGVSKKLKE